MMGAKVKGKICCPKTNVSCNVNENIGKSGLAFETRTRRFFFFFPHLNHMLTIFTEGFSVEAQLELFRSVCQSSRLSPLGVDAKYNTDTCNCSENTCSR